MNTLNRLVPFCAAFGAGLFFPETARASTYFLDFGSIEMQTTALGWTNVITLTTVEPTYILKDGSGVATGLKVRITDKFHSAISNIQGTTEPTNEAAIFVPSATGDSLFGHTGPWGIDLLDNPTAQLIFSGLDPARVYQFTLFASRMGVDDIRETRYEVVGAGAPLIRFLNASNNTSSVAFFDAVVPTPAGEVVLNVSAGNNNTNPNRFYYLGAMCITDTVPLR